MAFTALDMAHVPYLPHLVFSVQPSGSIFVFLMNLARLYGLPQIVFKRIWRLRASRKPLFKGFGACGPPANHFLKVLTLAGLPQITFKRFWCLRGSRKSLFKGFDACGPPANHFLKGLAFPHMAKVISRKVWHFRAWRKSFPEWFGVSAHGESVYNYLSIANILTKGLDRIELVEERELEPTP